MNQEAQTTPGAGSVSARCNARSRNESPTSLPRRGAALLIVITLLLLVGVGIGLALRTNIAARLEARRAAAGIQAEYLARAGFDLAATRLQTAPAYTGETWRIPAEQLTGRDAAQVVIEVAVDPENTSARRVTVVAEYPQGESSLKHRHRLERSWKPSVPSAAMP